MHVGLTKRMLQRIEFRIEELVLLLIVVLNIWDATAGLPADLDYIKKIISWSALGFLLYKSQPTKILFGNPSSVLFGKRKLGLDVIIILAYFSMFIKNLVSYAINVRGSGSDLLFPLYSALIAHAGLIELIGLYIGLFLLLVVAIRFTLLVPIKKPSVMSLLHKPGPVPRSFGPFFGRVATTYFVLLAFFIVVFNLIMEWLAVAIDAPLLMIGLATYIFFVIKHKEKFSPDSFLFRFGDFGSSFYKDVIRHFMFKKTIFRAIGGILVLHVLTDALNFLWPFVFNTTSNYYFGLFAAQHLSAVQIFALDSVGMALSSQVLLGVALVGNIFGMLFLLGFPGLMWYLVYKNRPFHPTRGLLGLIFFSLFSLLLTPAFTLRPIKSLILTGVDIAGQSAVSNAWLPLEWGVFVAATVSVIIIVLSSRLRIERFFMQLLIHVSQLFFTVYIAMFFFSVARYYVITIGLLGVAGKGLIALIFALFLAINGVFYIFGLFGFLSDTETHIKEHVRY